MKKWLSFILLAAFSILYVVDVTYAAETRGLTIIAKDSANGRQSEVKLYNKSYAVIIGIDNYLNLPPDRQLKNAVKDAKGVEEVLRKNYQFDRIITLYNEQATKDRIMEVLTEELPTQMDKEDALLLFWAGHGNQEKSDYGDLGYLIPFDGTTDKIRKNLTMAEIRDTISKKIPAKHVFYVMDACYSGLLTTRSVDGKTRRDLGYLREITKESARQVLTAGSKGEEALDGGPKGHSVFTGRLIEILESASDFITANELQASIREKVYSDASARNHTQTPGFGALYGLGDFVFIPKEKDRLGDLTGASVVRQKELEQLRQAEEEANAAKKREQAEIARKEKELVALDKQIAEMKGRLGTSAARTGDSLDSIIVMADQKEQQGIRLEELRRQREAEERKRQGEIERLKVLAKEKQIANLKSGLAKYKKIASSKYAQDMKGAAWNALLADYPEAKRVSEGDVEGLLAALGLVNYEENIVTLEEKKEKEGRIAEDDSFIAYDNGTVLNTRTNLMWAAKDNGADINWQAAKNYCENYRAGGYTNWRMPTRDELAGLYDKGKSYNAVCGHVAHLTELIVLTCTWFWASETQGSEAAYFHVGGGPGYWHSQTYTYGYRALPVRSAK
jgi:hypothetical protein